VIARIGLNGTPPRAHRRIASNVPRDRRNTFRSQLAWCTSMRSGVDLSRRAAAVCAAQQPTRAAICLWIVLAAARVAAQGEPMRGWDGALHVQLGYPGGFVQVGENQYPGNHLDLHGDLGNDVIETLDFDFAYHLTSQDRFRFSLQMIFLDGSTTLGPDDVFFNGTQLVGGTKLDTQTNFPDFFRTTALYERTLFSFLDRGTLSGRIGFTYVYLDFTLHGTTAASSPVHESKEDFRTQELPVPLLGFRLDYPYSDRVNLYGSLDGGYIPWLDSLRTEGGTVDLTQSHADLSLGISYKWSPALSIDGGFQYTYFVQHEKSHEDDNLIKLSVPALRLGATYRFH